MPSDNRRRRKHRANKTLRKRKAEGDRPVWIAHLRELRFRGLLVKRFKRSAPQQELILGAFQEEGWPDTIDNPLSPVGGRTLSDVLDAVVEHLGQRQVNPLLQFRNAGGGKRVGWVVRPGAKC